jgi:hypothetical protein
MRESVMYIANQLLFVNVTYFVSFVCVCVCVCTRPRVRARTRAQVHT